MSQFEILKKKMSSFGGKFDKLPGIVCDRFDNLKQNSDVDDDVVTEHFFLSHCHQDHMVGLRDLGGYLVRKSENGESQPYLYCSKISSSFLLSQPEVFPLLSARNIIELELNRPVTLSLKSNGINGGYKCRVTAMCANHCPGSLMFLFEKLENSTENVVERIFYTGDFRFEDESYLSRLAPLHDEEGKKLRIDEMFIDTTFFSSKFNRFPPRKVAEKRIWELVYNWVSRNERRGNRKKHLVVLHLPARYGYESILNMIYKKSKYSWRTHVRSVKFDDYLCSIDLHDCTDSDSRIAKYIHACIWNRNFDKCSNYLPCGNDEAKSSRPNVLHIKPSAMFFEKKHGEELADENVSVMISRNSDGEKHRICYGTHSSYQEILAFLKYFAPLKVQPSVIPVNETMQSVREQIENVMKEVHGDFEIISRDSRLPSIDNDSVSCLTQSLTQKRGNDGFNDSVKPKRIKSAESLDLFLDDSLEVVEEVKKNGDNLDDTPDIEDIIEKAETEEWPQFAIKSLKECKKKKDEVIVID